MSRLDKFLVTGDWKSYIHFFFQEVKPKLTFDHWPMMLQICTQSFGPKPFRFENMWTTHPSKSLVHKRWNDCDVVGWEGYCFMQKLTYVKGKLRDWNRSTFGNLKVNKAKLSKEVTCIDKMVEDGSRKKEEFSFKRSVVLGDLERNIKAEEIFWHQKAKYKWLKEGDGNSKFFHQLANGRKRKNLISSLVVDGEEIIDFEGIANEANLFERLYRREGEVI